MATKMIRDQFQILKEGVAAGLNQVAGIVKPVAVKPDIEIYNGLKPDDFQALVENFGEEATLKYIREMEAERQRS